jgi:hypothetical protein
MRRRLIATRQTTNTGFHFEPKHEISTRTGGPIRYLASRRCPTMTPTDGAEYFRNPALPSHSRTQQLRPSGRERMRVFAEESTDREPRWTPLHSDSRVNKISLEHSDQRHFGWDIAQRNDTHSTVHHGAQKCLNRHSHAGGALDDPFLLRRWGQVYLLPRLSIRQEYHSLIIRSHKKSARKKQTAI